MSAADDDPVYAVILEATIIAQLATTLMERRLPPGLSMAGFGVLNHFDRRPEPQTPSSLARAFQITKGAMTNTLQRLEAAGLVTVTADAEDGRVKRVATTEAGRTMRETSLARLQPKVRELAEALTEAELAALLPGLKSLRMWLDEHR